MRKYKVYKITCVINNKIYVGQTYETLEQRLNRHKQFSKTGKDTKFYRAMRKYGENNFYIELLEDCDSQEKLDVLEFEWIQKLNAVENGYNTKNSIGKCGGDTLSNHPNLDSIKKKISESKLGELNPNHTPIKAFNVKTKEEKFFKCIKEAQNYFQIERHDIISKRCRGEIKIIWNDWTFAYLDNDYSYTEKNLTGGCVSVLVIDTELNEKREFASYTLAQEYYGFPKGSINKKLNGKNPDTLYRNRYKFIKLQ